MAAATLPTSSLTGAKGDFPDVGISVTNPGAFGAYQTIGPLFDKGYSQIIQTYKARPPKQPDVPRALSDPRCIAPGTPTKTFSYEVFEQINEYVNITPFQTNVSNFTGGTAGISIAFNQLIGETSVTSITKNCVIAFEGHDVIDLDTTTLLPGGLPTNVFFPIYAGGKFIATEKDDFVTKASLEYDQRSSGNGVKGMVPSDELPLDSVFNKKGIFNPNVTNGRDSYTIDASSNVIDGSGGFLTYVAIDRPLFRDVITTKTSAIAQGVFIGTTFVASFVGPIGSAFVHVIRYAMVDIGTPGNPKFRWKMAESFGIDPKDKAIDPPGALFSSESANRINAAVFGKHYAYNVADPGDEMVKDFVNPSPLKKAYNPDHALAMMDSNSPFYVAGFKAAIQPLKPGSDFFQSRASIKSIWPSYTNINAPIKSADGLYPQDSYQPYMNLDGLSTWRTYESPIMAGEFNNLRVGFEYALHKTYASGFLSSVQTKNGAILLTRTNVALSGISAFYDASVGGIVVICAESGTATERIISNDHWNRRSDFAPTKSFLAGENGPFKSGGKTCLYSTKKDDIKEVNVSGKSISIPGGYTAFELVVSPPSSIDIEKPPVISLKTGSGTFEIGFDVVPKDGWTVGIPPLSLSSFDTTKASGSTIKTVRCSKNAGFLPSLEKVKVDNVKDADIVAQINELKVQDAPMPCGSISACELGNHTIIAYSYNNSVSLAFRDTASRHFLTVRESIHRMGPSGSKSRPIASQPFIVKSNQIDKAILLYVYQSRILAKTIPYNIFQSKQNNGYENGFLPDVDEAKMSADLQLISSTIAYDGHVKDKFDKIKPESDAGYIYVDTTDSPLKGDKQEATNVSNFSACTCDSYTAVFIQDGVKIKGRKTSDEGASWIDIFEPSFRMLPLKAGASTSTTPTSDPDGSFPFCYVDDETNIAMFFMFIDSSLLTLQFPSGLLNQERAFITKELKDVEITVAFGELSDNLKSRGVKLSNSVLDRQATKKAAKNSDKETIAPQRIAIAKNAHNTHRLFYYDDKQYVRSLISVDHGISWMTDTQFQKQG